MADEKDLQPSEFPVRSEKTDTGKQDEQTTQGEHPIEACKPQCFDQEKAITVPAKAHGRPKGKLGKRTQCFLELILSGKSTLDAYALAGYKGQKNAAYVLRSQLRDRIEERLLGDGVSREGLKLELQKLLKLPIHDLQTSVSVREKLQLLKFLDKLTENDIQAKPAITPFLVQVNDPKSVTINESK